MVSRMYGSNRSSSIWLGMQSKRCKAVIDCLHSLVKRAADGHLTGFDKRI